MEVKEKILKALEEEKHNFGLSHIEITEEDVANVISLNKNGKSIEEAVSIVLKGIKEIL